MEQVEFNELCKMMYKGLSIKEFSMKEQVLAYLDVYNNIIKKNTENKKSPYGEMPGDCYFVGEDILSIPRNDGDARYPYGENGFNYWTYASGYIHCNEGLFSPFLRACEGEEPKIGFFVGIKNSQNEVEKRFSILSVPILQNEPNEIKRFTVFSKDSTYYIAEVNELICCVKTFVYKGKIYFSNWLMNKTSEPLDIYSSSYLNPFLKHSLVENSTDRWFRQINFEKKGLLGRYIIETYEEKDRGVMATNYGIIKRSISDDKLVTSLKATTSRYDYVGGNRSSLHTSPVIDSGLLTKEKLATSFTETAICGDLLEFKLDSQVQVDMEFSFTKEEALYIKEMNQSFDMNQVSTEMEKLACSKDKPNLALRFIETALEDSFQKGKKRNEKYDLEENVMNPLMTHLMKQVEFCSEIKGFVQLSHFSLIGIRDVFQAIEGYLFYEPQKARAKMVEALDFTSPEGRMPRQYSLPKTEGDIPAMDLRPFIDQGVWVISTIVTYLKFTKDYDFLDEQCGYYEIVDEHKHLVKKSALKDSVLEHMIRIMDYLLANRDHENTHLVLALYGDWNDALDGLGKSMDPNKEYGSGVSVMATLQTYQNLNEMIELLVHRNSHTDQLVKLISARDEIRHGLYQHAIKDNRLVHGWGDKQSYYVGSSNDPDGHARDGITSNAFWILTGMVKEEKAAMQIPFILESFKRLESKYGMKTFEPYFEKGTLGVGRIPNLPKGTAENGATYIHASMFAVMALFAIGESKKAWEELALLMPFTHEKVSHSPYVIPNSYGLNPEFDIDGESMQDWQTGSSNVFLKTLIKYAFGFEPDYEGIWIQPSRMQPFGKMELEITYLGRHIFIEHCSKKNVSNEEDYILKGMKRQFTLNGQEKKGCFDPLMKIDKLFIEDVFIETYPKDEIIKIVIEDE